MAKKCDKKNAMNYPAPLEEIIELFEMLSEEERRESLIAYADTAPKFEPSEVENYDLEDVRKDEECTDTVGIFLNVDAGAGDKVEFRVSLGPKVQTLTRAMTAILCKSLNGARAGQVLEIPADFVPRIVGTELVRLRSQTVYYVLGRMKAAVKVYLNRRRAL